MTVMRVVGLLLALVLPSLGQGSRIERCLELLESESAADLAHAGHEAAELGLKPVAEKIAAMLATAPRTIETEIERAYVFRAFADALFLNRIAIDSTRLEKLRAEHAPLNMVIAVASLDPVAAADWLAAQLDQKLDADQFEIVVGLLTKTKSKAFGLALVRGTEPFVRVVVEGPRSGIGGMRGGRMYARRGKKEQIAPEGFPRLIDYELRRVGGKSCYHLGLDEGDYLLVHRCPLGLGSGIRPPDLTKETRRALLDDAIDRFSGLPMSEELKDETLLRFPADTKPKEIRDRVQLGREALAEFFWNRVRRMVAQDLLEAAEARKLNPSFSIQVTDQREKGAPKLWKMEGRIKPPEWLKELR